MADWVNISDSALDPDAPLTSELAYAWRDNVEALAQGATGAPYISQSWVAYEGVRWGDGVIGQIYGGTTVSTITSPTFESGYDYRFVFDAVITASSTATVSAALFVSGAWRSATAITDDSAASNQRSGVVDLLNPCSSSISKFIHTSMATTSTTANSWSASTSQSRVLRTGGPCTSIRFTNSATGGGNFSGGRIYMYTRKTMGGA